MSGEYPFDASTIPAALAPDFIAGETETLAIKPSQQTWPQIKQNIRSTVDRMIGNSDPDGLRLSVFPLAPVSTCIFLGYLLTNRLCVRSFQYHRDAHSWQWPKDNGTGASVSIRKTGTNEHLASDVVFAFSLSAGIRENDILKAVGENTILYHIEVERPSTSWLQTNRQLIDLGNKARDLFETALADHPDASRWHLFYAGPAPGAVTIGQQLNPTMIPQISLYEYQHPAHHNFLTITPEDSPLRTTLVV
jgi:hypothetical protein